MTRFADLVGKVVVVTGANGGMGSAISAALVDSGAHVVASDVHAQPNEVLQALPDVLYRSTDVSSEHAVAAFVEAALNQHGKLDCAVNAAAIEFELARLSDCESADFDRMMAVNLRGVFLCMKYQLKAMLQYGGGSIVNISSTTAFKPVARQPVYGASKHAVVGLTKQAAMDYAADRIRVNAIAPGNIDTPMLQDALTRRGLAAEPVAKRMPLGRFGRTQEVAEATLWLCSDVSAYTTGHVLAVEGGMLVN